MQHRRGFGLTIASELDLPSLALAEGPPDVTVLVHRGGAGGGPPVGFAAAPGRLELAVPGVGRFVVTDGDTITIHPLPTTDDDSVRLFLLGSAMGALLHQRGTLPLHASGCVAMSGAVLVVGRSGAGKTTLAQALARAGWPVLADDVMALRVEGDVVLAEPGPREAKVWPDSLKMLGDDADRYSSVRPALEKRLVPIPPTSDAAVPVRAVLALHNDNRVTEPQLRTGRPTGALALVKRNTYRPPFAVPLGAHPAHFATSSALVRSAVVGWVTRPTSGFPLDALAEEVIAWLDEQGVR